MRNRRVFIVAIAAWVRTMDAADWRLYGLDLPAEVLKAIYRDNAKRLLNWN